jgi:hypothetical protein
MTEIVGLQVQEFYEYSKKQHSTGCGTQTSALGFGGEHDTGITGATEEYGMELLGQASRQQV